jgi:D-psicose/D-tagatose/L-ribulose 3-epimerase
MKFGVNTFIWSAGFDAAIPLERIREAGIDGIEVPVFDAADLDVRALKQALSDNDFGCTFCSVNPPGFNPISDDPDVRRKTVEHWKRIIATAAEVGAELIAGPTYAPVGYLPGRRRTSDEWKWGVEFHQQLGAALDKAKVEIAIEPLNRFETYFLNTVADGVQLVEEIGHPRIGLLIDTFHSHIEEKNTAAGYRAAGRHLKHVHTCENDRGIPGTGQVDWPEVFQALRDVGYDRWLTIESFNSNIPQLSAATAIWRDLAPKMDDIAFVGTANLRQGWAAAQAGA